MGLAAAFQFLTAIPLRRETSAEDMGRSLPFFPVVGLMLGGLLLGLYGFFIYKGFILL